MARRRDHRVRQGVASSFAIPTHSFEGSTRAERTSQEPLDAAHPSIGQSPPKAWRRERTAPKSDAGRAAALERCRPVRTPVHRGRESCRMRSTSSMSGSTLRITPGRPRPHGAHAVLRRGPQWSTPTADDRTPCRPLIREVHVLRDQGRAIVKSFAHSARSMSEV
jgi:hypothetical protein